MYASIPDTRGPRGAVFSTPALTLKRNLLVVVRLVLCRYCVCVNVQGAAESISNK